MRVNFQFECSGKRPSPGQGASAVSVGGPADLVEGSPRSFQLPGSVTNAALGLRPPAGTDRRLSDAHPSLDFVISWTLQTEVLIPPPTSEITLPIDKLWVLDQPSKTLAGKPGRPRVWLQATPSRYCSPPLPPALHLDRAAFRHGVTPLARFDRKELALQFEDSDRMKNLE